MIARAGTAADPELQVVSAARPPSTRADCIDGPRPCRWEGCRHALPGGGCVLDYAAANPDGATLADVARVLGLTRQRILQLEQKAMRKLRAAAQRL